VSGTASQVVLGAVLDSGAAADLKRILVEALGEDGFIEVDADAQGRKRSGAGFLHGEGALPVYPGRLPLKPFADKFVVPECS